MKPRPRRLSRPVLVAYLLAIVMCGLSMVYANRVARESDRRWCGVVSTLDEAYKATPPSTPTGRDLAGRIHRLRADIGCP